MKVDYKRELEAAAKSMILVHEPDVLIKMIVRTIVHKVKVSHAGILLHDKEKDTYVLTVSRGPDGLKIPAGFARVDSDNALIRYFRVAKNDRSLSISTALGQEDLNKWLRRKITPQVKDQLKKIAYQMEIFGAEYCIPIYFRDQLMGVLLLGNKIDGKKFLREELDFFIALTSDVAMAIRNAHLFKELASELENKQHLFIHTTVALAAAIDAKDHYTHGHTARVTNLSLNIAKRFALKNSRFFDEKFLEDLHMASLLHDIGKIGIPESILNKDGPLNAEEKKKMQEHPIVGTTILQPIKELKNSLLGVKYHHEFYDGSGYPEGLKGEEIPLIAAIISVADTFDAMTTDRPYRRGLLKNEAVKEIGKLGGRQFHPKIVEAFIELYEEGKI